MANDEGGIIIDPNIKTNDDGTETILEEGDEGYVAPKVEDIKETSTEKVARLKGMLKRAETDAGIVDEPDNKKKTSKKSDELDYGQKAYLVSMGYKGADEMEKAKEIMAFTGKSLDEVLENKHFQAEIKEMRDVKATNDALPVGSKRSSNSAADSVEYWIAKGELPPADQRELRTKVVNARIVKEKSKSTFTDTPVAGK